MILKLSTLVIVSAPFGNEGGEIFIYTGNDETGVYSEPSQRIKRQGAVDWFGFSVEMAKNLLIVGSPYLDRVETFRLKPAIEVKLTTKWLPSTPIQFETTTIKLWCPAF